ncbi:MAG: ATP-grasp domain-containing protein [Candidatus ainarchaeum sp.]|nr:ATP-grasp domain-containing protein [Candidatus ainarchaeum sp.]
MRIHGNLSRQNLSSRREIVNRFIRKRTRGKTLLHWALRGIDVVAFSRRLPFADILVASCDEGSDLDLLRREGTTVHTLEKAVGYRAKWGSDDVGRIGDMGIVQEIIRRSGKRVIILPFKNCESAEILREQGVEVFAPRYELMQYFDSKLNLPEILKAASITRIPGEVIQRDFNFEELEHKYGLPLVVQVDFGSGGNGTYFVKTRKELMEIFEKKGVDKLKVSKCITGPSFNAQAVVLETDEGIKTVMTAPSFQIIGIPEISTKDSPACYGGNEYTGAWDFLGDNGKREYVKIMTALGKVMGEKGWRGIFGIDFIFSTEEQRIYVVEINPRMNASTSFLHSLQERIGELGIMNWHLLAMALDRPVPRMYLPTDIRGYDGSHLKLANNEFSERCVISGCIRPGVYALSNDLLVLRSEQYWSNTLVGGEHLITCGVPAVGTILESNATLLKVYSVESVLDETKKALNETAARVVRKIHQMLNLREM